MEMFVDCVVCPQDYTKTTKQISMKLRWRMGIGSEQTPLPFGLDPDKGTEPGISLTLCDWTFFYLSLNFSGENAWKRVYLYNLMWIQIKNLDQADLNVFDWIRPI